jgi:hypothetical protein
METLQAQRDSFQIARDSGAIQRFGLISGGLTVLPVEIAGTFPQNSRDEHNPSMLDE